MRYSVFVVTAAQYIGELYGALAKGRPFGQAASQGRKHLAANPDRWVGLNPRPLQDWFVPVVYEAGRISLLTPEDGDATHIDYQPPLDPVATCAAMCPTLAFRAGTKPCSFWTGPLTTTRWSSSTPMPRPRFATSSTTRDA